MYKKAIENLTSKEINFEAICIEVAKSNPSIFNKAFSLTKHRGHDNNYSHRALMPYDPIPEEDDEMYHAHSSLNIDIGIFRELFGKWGNALWFQEVMFHLFSNTGDGPEKIKAIKAYRAVTGDGLRECKHFVERIIDRSGYMPIDRW